MHGIIGKKIGMTKIFNKKGNSIPVTVVYVEPNRITQIKNSKIEKYNSIQLTTGKKKKSRTNKAEKGHFLKSKTFPGCGLWEFRTKNTSKKKLGEKIRIDAFKKIKTVDVTGISKGKGFSGTIKRWNFHSQDASHGNSLSHRAPGSTGQNQTPGRVFKGKKMAGQLGNVRVTIQNLEVIKIDTKKNLIIIKGSIPGSNNKNVIVNPSVKNKK